MPGVTKARGGGRGGSGFACQECGYAFRTVAAAERASFGDGCPRCGGADIDLAATAVDAKAAAAAKVGCPVCVETGVPLRSCPLCCGTGEVTKGTLPCEDCRGSGYVGAYVCGCCRGTGRGTPCRECRGIGRIGSCETDAKTCRNCEGSGVELPAAARRTA